MPAWPPALRTGSFDAMLNFDIADHPIYDGLELHWFDDVAMRRARSRSSPDATVTWSTITGNPACALILPIIGS